MAMQGEPVPETLSFEKEQDTPNPKDHDQNNPKNKSRSPKSKKKRGSKKKKNLKEASDDSTSDSDAPPVLTKTSPNKLHVVNPKTGSSIPLRTPSDYMDMSALPIDFSALWDDVDWSDEEVGLSADALRQRNQRRRR